MLKIENKNMPLMKMDEPTTAQSAGLKVQEPPVSAARSSAPSHQGETLIFSFLYLAVTDSGYSGFNLVGLIHPKILSVDSNPLPHSGGLR